VSPVVVPTAGAAPVATVVARRARRACRVWGAAGPSRQPTTRRAHRDGHSRRAGRDRPPAYRVLRTCRIRRARGQDDPRRACRARHANPARPALRARRARVRRACRVWRTRRINAPKTHPASPRNDTAHAWGGGAARAAITAGTAGTIGDGCGRGGREGRDGHGGQDRGDLARPVLVVAAVGIPPCETSGGHSSVGPLGRVFDRTDLYN